MRIYTKEELESKTVEELIKILIPKIFAIQESVKKTREMIESLEKDE